MTHDTMVPCPHCGEEIKSNAHSCPHCGSDDETGWSEGTYLDGIDIPDEDSYEEIRRNEFGDRERLRTVSHRLIIIILSVVVIVVFIVCILMRLHLV